MHISNDLADGILAAGKKLQKPSGQALAGHQSQVNELDKSGACGNCADWLTL